MASKRSALSGTDNLLGAVSSVASTMLCISCVLTAKASWKSLLKEDCCPRVGVPPMTFSKALIRAASSPAPGVYDDMNATLARVLMP